MQVSIFQLGVFPGVWRWQRNHYIVWVVGWSLSGSGLLWGIQLMLWWTGIWEGDVRNFCQLACGKPLPSWPYFIKSKGILGRYGIVFGWEKQTKIYWKLDMGIWMFKQSRFYLKQIFPCQFIEQMGSPGDSVWTPRWNRRVDYSRCLNLEAMLNF